jgi:hypothetical protein
MPNSFRRRAVGALVFLIAAAPLVMPRAAAEEDVPLAIKGYDPVAYFTLGEPTQGLAALEYEWDEHRYRFSRPEHRELFKSDPAHYAPQFAQFCAMALSKGELVEADPKYWLVSDGHLYIFGKASGPASFKQKLSENLEKANKNRALIP